MKVMKASRESNISSQPTPKATSIRAKQAANLDTSRLLADLHRSLEELRNNPLSLAEHLADIRLNTNDTPSPHYVCPQARRPVQLHEGRRVVLEAEEAIKTQQLENSVRHGRSFEGLVRLPALDAVAQAAADDMGAEGLVSHAPGGNSLKNRVEEIGTWTGVIAENICVLDSHPKSILATWLIDDGNITRNQRKALFLPQ